MADYIHWKNKLSTEELKDYSIKYYKGLGTSTADEAREYFSNLNKHLIPFSYEGDHDFERLDMAFRSHRASDRRQWLLKHLENENVKDDKNLLPNSTISISNFVDKELVLFSPLNK